MPIGPGNPNPMAIDVFVTLWFVSMLAGIITNQTFTIFEYFISFFGGLYLSIRIYYTWFYKPEIDPRLKDVWAEGYEEGVKLIQEVMEDEENPIAKCRGCSHISIAGTLDDKSLGDYCEVLNLFIDTDAETEGCPDYDPSLNNQEVR